MSNNDQSSGISTPPDLTNYIVKQEDQYSNCGRFGDVHRCWYDGSEDGIRKEVAVKVFRFKLTMDEDVGQQSESPQMIRRELGIWKRLNHANIVPFLGITYGFGMSGTISLVSLWMHNGTLHDFLAQHDHSLSVPRRLQLLLDIVNGLNCLHSFSIGPIVHGDLSSNNVLVDANYTARLADFGHASLVGSIPEALSYLQMSTKEGTLRWAAPELVRPQEAPTRTTKSDIYSFGCISLQVLSGKQPWSEIKEELCVVFSLAQGLNPARPECHKIDDQHWNLIQQCWSPVQERPSAESVIASIQLLLRNSQPCSASPPERRTNVPSNCEWNSQDGITCGELVTPVNVPAHFGEHHGIRNMDAMAQWNGRGSRMFRKNFIRHILEAHLGVRRSIARSSH